jgi:ribosomal protein L21E
MKVTVLPRLCLLAMLAAGTVAAQVSSTRRSPTSKFYVAEVEGFSQINTGEKIEDLTEKSVFDAEGSVIETQPDSVNALVLSNGTGMFFAEDTRVVIRRFLQEPFQPDRVDLDSEPSVSQSRFQISRGSTGYCTGKLVSGSSFIIETPQGSISVLSQSSQKFAILLGPDRTTITLFEGSLTLRGDQLAGGEALRGGQQAVIQSGSPAQISIGGIPDEGREAIEEMVNAACQARKKVYFDVAERELEVDGARDTYFVPINTPSEPGPIVSPARPVVP